MTDLEYTIRSICARRGVVFEKAVNGVLSLRYTSTLASGYDFLPTVANTFYFIDTMIYTNLNAITGIPYIALTDYGSPVGVAGGRYLSNPATAGFSFMYRNIQTDRMHYEKNTHSNGDICLFTNYFTVTYSA